jgi:hypothetical protein
MIPYSLKNVPNPGSVKKHWIHKTEINSSPGFKTPLKIVPTQIGNFNIKNQDLIKKVYESNMYIFLLGP